MPNSEYGGDLDAVLGGSFVQYNANVCAVVNVNTFAKKDEHSQYIIHIYINIYIFRLSVRHKCICIW